ncbi:MAG: NADH-quinone oxidoreductase subunit N [Desulfobulbus sp.]|jgi:NADH-quinone oxidoreductase subunit N
MLILPELVVLGGAFLFFTASLTGKAQPQLLRTLALLCGLTLFASVCIASQANGLLFFASYAVTPYSQLFKILLAGAFLFVLIAGQKLTSIHSSVQAEYYLFLFLGVFGLMLLVSANEFILLFVALELSSFALYLLVPMRDDRDGLRPQMEASIKYLLFGVIATGFMLFGMSYLFALTGSTSLPAIADAIQQGGMPPVALVALLLVLCGFFFKLAVFPFHFWVPDVYQGAANETAIFVATLPKIAAVAILIRLMQFLPPGHEQFVVLLFAVLALVSMFYGNLCALVQDDIKRLLGFSGIAHAGFILLGLLTLQEEGYGLAMYYISAYVLMNLACFLVLCALAGKGQNLRIADLHGLSKRQPILAFILATGLFGLAGIPPFAGFMGKFLVLTETLNKGHLLVVVLAVINTAIAIYYYLLVVRAAYTVDDDSAAAAMPSPSLLTTAAGIILVLAIILVGILPAKLITLATTVVQSLG